MICSVNVQGAILQVSSVLKLGRKSLIGHVGVLPMICQSQTEYAVRSSQSFQRLHRFGHSPSDHIH